MIRLLLTQFVFDVKHIKAEIVNCNRVFWTNNSTKSLYKLTLIIDNLWCFINMLEAAGEVFSFLNKILLRSLTCYSGFWYRCTQSSHLHQAVEPIS